MTILNETARLFFAVTALILVGMLSAPMGDMSTGINNPVEMKAVERTTAAAAGPTKTEGAKLNKKSSKITKGPIAKGSVRTYRKISRRGTLGTEIINNGDL